MSDGDGHSRAVMECKNVFYGYSKNKDVLYDISLAVCEKELLYVVGASGCGKTTLAKVASGFIAPRTGQVESRKDQPVSYVPQFPEKLFLFDTVEAEFDAIAEESRRVHSLTMLLELGLDNDQVAGLAPRRLSFGQRRLLGIALQTRCDPSFLVLDEPSLGLDDRNVRWFERWLSARLDRNCAMLLVTHDLELIRLRPGRLAVLQDGHVRWQGESEVFLDSPDLLALAAAT